VGTSDATRKIRTGDKIRLNGTTGLVQVLSGSQHAAPAQPAL
jgi:pyruvate,water dikinase